MDSLTHLTLGACLGEAILGRRLGKRALLLGAGAQNLPDLDGLASFWLPVSESLLMHRGITHSLPVGLVAAGGLAWLARRWRGTRDVPLGYWFFFFALQICLHDLLDTTNAYGTGLLEPFSQRRFSVHLLYVADPFFTLPLLLAALALLVARRKPCWRTPVALTAVGWAVAYLGYATYNKSRLERPILAALSAAKMPHSRYLATPTPLNTWLWYIVAETDRGYYTGYLSVFENPGQPTNFAYHPRNADYLSEIQDTPQVFRLLRFADGYFTVEKRSDSLAINVLRFGQVLGWENPQAPFAFRHQLDSLREDRLVVQRGRFAGWNRATLRAFVERIRANPSPQTSPPRP